MALVSKSIDEETEELTDIYDELIKPKKVWRNHNNKLYLIFRACAAGIVGVIDAALALHNRFNPRLCDDTDLYSAAGIVGTDFKQGKGSIVNVTIKNKSLAEQKVLSEGTYSFQSSLGMIFYFQLANNTLFEPGEERVIAAISQEKGNYPVMRNMNIRMFRADSQKIDPAFIFACDDNIDRLGYPDETPYDFRTRILNDPERQDHLKELELKIRNLPNIFECNLVFNESDVSQEYDGITLAGKELLITITGVPTDKIAELVAEQVIYSTHMVDPADVVYYYNNLYINGKYPVYFKYHDKIDFSLSIQYEYDSGKLKSQQVEDFIEGLFKPYTRMVTYVESFSEGDAYKVLDSLKLPGVKIRNVDVVDSDNNEVPFIRIPKTRLANLTGIVFTAVDTERQG